MRRAKNLKGMMRASSATLALILGSGLFCAAQGRSQQRTQSNLSRQPYSIAEYNNFEEAVRAKSATEEIILLDAFVSKYPDSPLFAHVYPSYHAAYEQLGNFPKVMEYAERLLSLNHSVDINTQVEATFAWVRAYNGIHSKDLVLAAKAREMAQSGLVLIASIKRPDSIDKKAFAEELRRGMTYLDATWATAAMVMKDYTAAIESLGMVMDLTSYDPSELRGRPMAVPY